MAEWTVALYDGSPEKGARQIGEPRPAEHVPGGATFRYAEGWEETLPAVQVWIWLFLDGSPLMGFAVWNPMSPFAEPQRWQVALEGGEVTIRGD
jgi:hypothetical protein